MPKWLTDLAVKGLTSTNELLVDSTKSSFAGEFKHKPGTSGFAPSSIMLNEQDASHRGAGVYGYNYISGKTWFSGKLYNGDWGISFLNTGSFETSAADVTNALLQLSESGTLTTKDIFADSIRVPMNEFGDTLSKIQIGSVNNGLYKPYGNTELINVSVNNNTSAQFGENGMGVNANSQSTSTLRVYSGSSHSTILKLDQGFQTTADFINAIPYGGTSVFKVDPSGNTTANSFIKSGGTASQFLMADGSTQDLTGIADDQYVKKSGDDMTGRLRGNYNLLEAWELSSTGEDYMVWNPALYNDLGYLFDRGGSITTISSPTNKQITSNVIFDGSSNHATINATDMPIVFEVDFPETFNYGLRIGIAFGSVNFRAKDVKIETLTGGVWQTILDETESTKVKFSANVNGNSSPGTNKARFTLANPYSTDSYIRVVHIWAGRYNSQLARTMFVGRDGGDLYGDINSTGGASFDNIVEASALRVGKNSTYPFIEFGSDTDNRLLVRAGDALKWRANGVNDYSIYHEGNLTPDDYLLRDGSLPMTGSLEGYERIDVRDGGKALYMYNFNGTIKLDAYDYTANASIPFDIGGNGGEIRLQTNTRFYGNLVKNGSSDSYMLLGGGGTKLLSDFYSSTTKTTDWDTTEMGYFIDLGSNAMTNRPPDSLTNYRGYSFGAGQYNLQLGFGDNPTSDIYVRHNSSSGFTSWGKILTSSNLQNLSDLNDDILAGNYLPRDGSLPMTGNLLMPRDSKVEFFPYTSIESKSSDDKLYVSGRNGIVLQTYDGNTTTLVDSLFLQYNEAVFDANVTANSFIKSGSSDSYMLLGGGGTKLLSDFALYSDIPTDYVPYRVYSNVSMDSLPIDSFISILSTTLTDKPFDLVGAMFSGGNGSSVGGQLVLGRDGNNASFRGIDGGGNYSSWKELYHTGNLTPDSYLKRDGSLPMTGDLEVQGLSNQAGIYSIEGGVTKVLNPKGGTALLGGSGVIGAVKITLPNFYNSAMLRFTIDFYDYNTDKSFSMMVGGYAYGATNTWISPFTQTIAGQEGRDLAVRFGDDGVNCCVWVGEVDSDWDYTVVSVNNFTTRRSESSWAENWNISLVTAFDTVKTTKTNNFPYADWNKLKGKPTDLMQGDVNDYLLRDGSLPMIGNLVLGSNEIHIGDKGADNWSRLFHGVDGVGFTSQYGNGTTIVNEQGGVNQAIFLGDTDTGNGNTLFGVSTYSAGWNKVLNLLGTGELYLGTNSNQVYHTGNLQNLSDLNNDIGYITGVSWSDVSGKPLGLYSGDEIPASADLNTYTSMGLYYQANNNNASSGTNYPIGVAGALTVKTRRDLTGAGAFVHQEYHTYEPYNEVYVRAFFDNNWSPWRKQYHTGNLTNVSQLSNDSGYLSTSAGGTMTGDITMGTGADLLVGGNRYAFRYSADQNYGMYFNSSAPAIEVKGASAVNQWSINVTTGNMWARGSVTGTSFIKTGGTADDILLGDGSTTSLAAIGGAESDTLQSVTDRGNTTTNDIYLNGGRLRSDQMGVNTQVINPTTGVIYMGNPNTNLSLEGTALTYNDGTGVTNVYHSGNLTNVSQLTNDAGYLTTIPNFQQVLDAGSNEVTTGIKVPYVQAGNGDGLELYGDDNDGTGRGANMTLGGNSSPYANFTIGDITTNVGQFNVTNRYTATPGTALFDNIGSYTVKSTRAVNFRIEADTDNSDETDTATLELIQDGGIVGMRFGMDSSNRSYFQNIYSSVGTDFYIKNHDGSVMAKIASQEWVNAQGFGGGSSFNGGTITDSITVANNSTSSGTGYYIATTTGVPVVSLDSDTSAKPSLMEFNDLGVLKGQIVLDRGVTPIVSGTVANDIALGTVAGSGNSVHLFTEGISRFNINSSGNATFDSGTNTTVTVKSDDTGTSKLELYGDSQGTGHIYVGQSTGYGGGLEYNGDNSPGITGAGSDFVTLFRKDNGTYHWTARNPYNSNAWEFRTTPTVGSTPLATQSWVQAQGYSTGGGGTADGYVSGLTFSGGTLTAVQTGAANQSISLDGRYLLAGAKAADSDKLDNLNSTQFLRSDADDTFTGKLAIGSTSSRSGGIYGIYDSNKIGHVWSMGTAYSIPNTGADFGNLYGIAYKHTNNSTGGTMAGGHQAVFCNNGNPGVSVGFNGGVWSRLNMEAPDFVGTSDRRLKENIEEYEPKLVKSNYKYFNFIDDEEKQVRLGVIAQELEEEHPEFVRTNEDGVKSVSYNDLHSAEIAYLKDKVEKQEKEIEELKMMMKKILENGGNNK